MQREKVRGIQLSHRSACSGLRGSVLLSSRTQVCMFAGLVLGTCGLEDVGGTCLGFGVFILTGIWLLVFDTPIFQVCLSILVLKVQERSMSFKSKWGLWRMLEVTDWGLAC